MTPGRLFLDFSVKKLVQLTGRIETCLDKLTPDQLWARGGENENAVGNLVLHLCGNVRQWIVSGIGGAPDVRRRDAEFTARGGSASAGLAATLRDVVAEAERVLTSLPPERLTEPVVIQNYEMSILEAIYHVVEHFSGHTGQIIFATKMLTSEDLGFYRHLKSSGHSEKTP